MNKSSPLPRVVFGVSILLALIAMHIIPLPILEVLFLFVIVGRPRWFKNMVDRLYDE